MNTAFEEVKQQVISNTVFIVVARPGVANYGEFHGCYENLEAAFSALTEAHSYQVQEVIGLDEDDKITANHVAEYLDRDFHIIPIFGLTKQKKIYVELTGNYFYKGISNEKPIKAKVCEIYDFSNSLNGNNKSDNNKSDYNSCMPFPS